MTASPKLSFRASWKVGDAVVDREIFLMRDVNEWTSLPMTELLTTASCSKDWTRISVESTVMFTTPTPTTP